MVTHRGLCITEIYKKKARKVIGMFSFLVLFEFAMEITCRREGKFDPLDTNSMSYILILQGENWL